MNKKTVLAFGLCVFCAVSAFAQQKMVTGVTRGIAKARLAAKPAVSFVPKYSLPSVVNGYLRTPNVTRFTLPDGTVMRAVRFSRNIKVEKEDLLIPEGSLAVVNPDGKIELYGPQEELPSEIKAGMDAAFEEEHSGFLQFLEGWAEDYPSSGAAVQWTGKAAYSAQTDLAKDVDAYYDGQSGELLTRKIDGAFTKVYRIPSYGIYYQPNGRAGRYLNPDEDLILFHYAKKDGTPINDGQIVFGGVTDPLWKDFFEVLPQ